MAVQRHQGQVVGFQTDSGRIISYRKAILEAEQGDLEGVFLQQTVGLDHSFSHLPTLP